MSGQNKDTLGVLAVKLVNIAPLIAVLVAAGKLYAMIQDHDRRLADMDQRQRIDHDAVTEVRGDIKAVRDMTSLILQRLDQTGK